MTEPYFVGTEDIHFIPIGSPIVRDWFGTFRMIWSRCSLVCNAGPFVDERWRAPLPHLPVSTDEFWWTCQIYQVGSSILGHTSFVEFRSSDDVPRIRVFGQNGSKPELWRQDSDETLTKLATGTLPMPSVSRLGKIDIYVSLSDGIFRLYVDRVLVLDFTGDLTNSSEYDAIIGFDIRGSYSGAHYSEICWTQDDTRKFAGVYDIWPESDGNATDWNGSKDDVDEIESDITDANWTDTPDLIQQYRTRALPALTGNVRIAAVMLGAEMATDPVDVALDIRVNSTDYFSADFSTGGVPERKMKIWEQNPGTSSDFTKDELNSSEFNIGVKSA